VNRRDFISAIAAALSAVAVPAVGRGTLTVKKPEVGAAEVPGFNPAFQYGNAVHLSERNEKTVEVARELVLKDARERLPRGTRFYVLDGGEARVHGEFGPQRIDMLAWYYSPQPLTGPRLAQVIAEVVA